jgi:hypothetical protein
MLGKWRVVCLLILVLILVAPAAADISQKFSFQNPEDDMVGWLWYPYEPCDYPGGQDVKITNLTDDEEYDWDWSPVEYRRVGPGLDVNFLRAKGYDAYIPSSGPFAYFAWSTMDSWNEHYKVGDYPTFNLKNDDDDYVGYVSPWYDGEVVPTTTWENRWEVIRKYNKCQVWKNGVFYYNYTDCTETFYKLLLAPSLTDFGCEFTGIKDLIIGGGSPNMISTPSHSWYVAKDLVSPDLSGLYDEYGNVVYDSIMHFHWSVGMLDGGSMPGRPYWNYSVKVKALSEGMTVWETSLDSQMYHPDCQDILPGYYYCYGDTGYPYSTTGTVDFDFGTSIIGAGKPFGVYEVGLYKGDNLIAWDYFVYKANGATVIFSKGTYSQGEVVIADTDISGAYWQPTVYTYRFDILDIYGNVIDTDAVDSQTMRLAYASGDWPAGDYYGLVTAVKRSDSTEYTLGFDIFTIADYVDMAGYTMDGYANSLLSGTLVNESQSPAWFNTTASGGLYNLSGFVTGIEIGVNASHPGYTFSPYGWAPVTYGTYDVNLTLLPVFIPNNTAFVGLVRVDWNKNPIDGATAYISNGSWSSTTTTNLAGYYIFDNLAAGEVYTLSAYKMGYGNESTANSTAAVAGVATIHDMDITPEYLVTINVKNLETGMPITDPVEIAITPTGESNITSTGSAVFDMGYGVYTATVTSNDYVTGSSAFIVTKDKSVSIYLTPKSSQSQGSITYYTQKQVRFKIVDAFGTPLAGANVTANYISTTLPSTDPTWLISAFGISSTVAGEMTNSGLAMAGLTAADGGLVFTMFPSLTYGLTITDAVRGINHYTTIMPQDSDYIIYTALPSQAVQNSSYMPGQLGNTSIYVVEPDPNHVTFCIRYIDSSALTTNLKFDVWKWANSSTPGMIPVNVYHVDLGNPGASLVTDCSYTAVNIRGDEYRFVYNATRSAPL